jgi:TolB protein
MTARTRTAAAIALTVAVTAGAATALTGCASTVKVGAGTGGSASASSAPASSAPASGTPSTGPSTPPPATPPAALTAPVLNGTGGSRLTISDGTSRVLMNGGAVDFGITVRDLAWNPAGTRAAFIDGAGNLDVANADGTGRVMVARAPSGQNWSHPTWQVTPYRKAYGVPASSFLTFAASGSGGLRLETVSSTAVNGTPQPLDVDPGVGTGNSGKVPQTGNAWPSAGGGFGVSVYANAGTGQVYLRDDYLREQASPFGPGSEPSLSADGRTVAFVRSVDGHDHLFTESAQTGSTARDLTPNATTDYTEPAWSPDGKTLAVRVPNGVATVPADGSTAPTRISSVAGLPAYS